jgi:2-methylfumaryl-CoA hydratase
VCAFDRKALVRAGRADDRPPDPPQEAAAFDDDPPRAPSALLGPLPPRPRHGGFAWFWEDFAVGDVIVHANGRTVSESEAMALSTLTRNSHPMHVDEQYCRVHSFAKTRVVYGGLVLSWVLALSSRDTAGNAVWDLGLDEGAHPGGVLAGDTLYAASKVLATEARGPDAGTVTLRVVGLKNARPRPMVDQGMDLFSPELGKTAGKVPEKVVEITRTLLVRRRERGHG